MSEFEGFILRIATRQWVNQVFGTAIYYTNLHRKWKRGQTILFVHKMTVGDAVVGYGVIEKIWEKDELPENDKNACERGGWKRALEFQYVKQFERPLPIKETFLKDSKLRGRYFHGLKLNRNQLKEVLAQAGA